MKAFFVASRHPHQNLFFSEINQRAMSQFDIDSTSHIISVLAMCGNTDRDTAMI